VIHHEHGGVPDPETAAALEMESHLALGETLETRVDRALEAPGEGMLGDESVDQVRRAEWELLARVECDRLD
jgi:hypothetical protein